MRCKEHKHQQGGGAVCTQGKCTICKKVVGGLGVADKVCSVCSKKNKVCTVCGEKVEKLKQTSNKDLKEIALDIYKGNIFTDRNIPVAYKKDLSKVFMTLLFLDKEQIESLKKKKATLIYEYVSKAAPISINGMPSFTSFAYLTEDEVKTVDGYLKQLVETEEKFKESNSGGEENNKGVKSEKTKSRKKVARMG